MMRSSSGKIVGLSVTELISVSSTEDTYLMASFVAPCTCGTQRKEYGSCTCLPGRAMSSLPSNSLRTFSPVSICPLWGRICWIQSMKGSIRPSKASNERAAIKSAFLERRKALRMAKTPLALINCVPFNKASPSLLISLTGSQPNSSSTLIASRFLPL